MLSLSIQGLCMPSNLSVFLSLSLQHITYSTMSRSHLSLLQKTLSSPRLPSENMSLPPCPHGVSIKHVGTELAGFKSISSSSSFGNSGSVSDLSTTDTRSLATPTPFFGLDSCESLPSLV